MPVGLHLVLDGLASTLPDRRGVQTFLFQMAERLHLAIIDGPFVYDHANYQEAWVIVAESHIAVKWFPSGLVLTDVFSCKMFDREPVSEFIVTTFGLEYWRSRVIERMGVE